MSKAKESKAKKEKKTAKSAPEVKKTPAEQFVLALKNADISYLYILAISGLLTVGGIFFATVSRVSVGLGVCIGAVLIYMGMTRNMLKKDLGIAYRSTSGSLTVTELFANGREEIFIPSRAILLNVTEIESYAFKHEGAECIKAVHLPATLTCIGKDIFAGCESLTTVYFQGSREQLTAIECGTDLSPYELIFDDGATYQTPRKKKEKKQKKDKKAERSAKKSNGGKRK